MGPIYPDAELSAPGQKLLGGAIPPGIESTDADHLNPGRVLGVKPADQNPLIRGSYHHGDAMELMMPRVEDVPAHSTPGFDRLATEAIECGDQVRSHRLGTPAFDHVPVNHVYRLPISQQREGW